MDNVESHDDNFVDSKSFNYNLTKVKNKDDGGPTLLELQRSSAVISGLKNRKNSQDGTTSTELTSQNDRYGLTWVCHFDHRIKDIVLWKNISRSLFTLLWMLTSLFILRSHSFIYLLTSSLLSLLIVMLLFVGGCALIQATTSSTVTHPFASLLSRTITIPESAQESISSLLLSLITGSVDFIARIVLVQSFGLTLRFVALVWLVWAYIDDLCLFLMIKVCLIFTLPKLYMDHAEKCESLVEMYEENPITGLVNAHFKIKESLNVGGRKNSIVSQSKDLISASVSGIIIVLFVKYFLSDDQGKIPNLFSYLWST